MQREASTKQRLRLFDLFLSGKHGGKVCEAFNVRGVDGERSAKRTHSRIDATEMEQRGADIASRLSIARVEVDNPFECDNRFLIPSQRDQGMRLHFVSEGIARFSLDDGVKRLHGFFEVPEVAQEVRAIVERAEVVGCDRQRAFHTDQCLVKLADPGQGRPPEIMGFGQARAQDNRAVIAVNRRHILAEVGQRIGAVVVKVGIARINRQSLFKGAQCVRWLPFDEEFDTACQQFPELGSAAARRADCGGHHDKSSVRL
ncbi:hypothetical protein D9M73_97470 [compost metagenome]